MESKIEKIENAPDGGVIELGFGYNFLWMSDASGEVYGSVEAPSGQFVSQLSGWWRTKDPEIAAKSAQQALQF